MYSDLDIGWGGILPVAHMKQMTHVHCTSARATVESGGMQAPSMSLRLPTPADQEERRTMPLMKGIQQQGDKGFAQMPEWESCSDGGKTQMELDGLLQHGSKVLSTGHTGRW